MTSARVNLNAPIPTASISYYEAKTIKEIHVMSLRPRKVEFYSPIVEEPVLSSAPKINTKSSVSESLE